MASDHEHRPEKKARILPESPKEDDGTDTFQKQAPHTIPVHGVSVIDRLSDKDISEKDVGIRNYISASIPGFNAIIKHRFTDFLVNEVGLDGTVCRLTDISRPAKNITQEAKPPPPPQDTQDSLEITPEARAELLRLTDDTKFIDELAEFIAKGKPTSPKDFSSVTLSTRPVESKAIRTQTHGVIRHFFNSRLETVTSDDNTILIQWARKVSNRRSANKQEGELHKEPYITFNLHKSNRETHDALQYLAKQLNTTVRKLGIAGTKDKRAVTVQKVSLRRDKRNHTLDQVWCMANGASMRQGNQTTARGLRGTRIGDLAYADQPVDLGDLKGNMFRIILRELPFGSEQNISSAIESLKEKGFINYFGMQRFGTMSVPTHAIGLAILKRDWALAIELLLRPRSGEDEHICKARLAWIEDKDPAKALQGLPRRFVGERAALDHLKKYNPEDYAGAMKSIPKFLRMMYLHAYQSYIWNEAVSYRVDRYGLEKVVKGDLVYAVSHSSEKDLDLLEEVEATLEEVEEEKCDEEKTTSKKSLPTVKKLTAEDIQTNNYSIYDVILPLPGDRVEFPANDVHDRYRQLLETDGLDIENLRHNQKEYSSSGTYRKILHKPSDVTFCFKKYTNPDATLARTDEEVVLGIQDLDTIEDAPVNVEDDGTAGTDDNNKASETARLAVQIEMKLSPSTYATMALREVLKYDTSTIAQSALSAAIE